MNKIYKVIYSKVRNCYVVVSELAKNQRKCHSVNVKGKTALAAAILLALTSFCLTGMPVVQADESILNNDFIGANDYYWYYDEKEKNEANKWKTYQYKATDAFNNRSRHDLPNYKGAGAKFPGAITAGLSAQAGQQTVTIGDRNAGASSGSVFIGEHSGYDDGGKNSPTGASNNYVTSVGFQSDATGWGSIAIGSNAIAENSKMTSDSVTKVGNYNTTGTVRDDTYSIEAKPAIEGASVALGYNAHSKDGNIAIGADSVATAAASTLGTAKFIDTTDTDSQAPSSYISVGSSALKRRITNVAPGSDDNDVATVGQLSYVEKEAQAKGSWKLTAGGTNESTVVAGSTVDFSAGTDGNLSVSKDKTSNKVTIGLNKDVILGKAAQGEGGSLSVYQDPSSTDKENGNDQMGSHVRIDGSTVSIRYPNGTKDSDARGVVLGVAKDSSNPLGYMYLADGNNDYYVHGTMTSDPQALQGRLVYHSSLTGYNYIANLEDGISFSGDAVKAGSTTTNTTADTRLDPTAANHTLSIKGGVTDTTRLTSDNIGVVTTPTEYDGTLNNGVTKAGGLTIQLAKNLKGITSIANGADGSGAKITLGTNGTTISGGDVNVSTHKITGLQDGTAATDAATVGQMNTAIGDAKTKYYSVQEGPQIDGFSTNEKNNGASALAGLAAGYETGTAGIGSTVVGSYSGVMNTGTTSSVDLRGAASISLGTLNLNQNTDTSKTFSGVANSIVGQGNMTTNSNAAIILGAGNTITDSYRNVTIDTSKMKTDTPEELEKALQKAVPESGGQVMAIGGGNKITSAYKTQVVGLGNTVSSTELNYVEGFNNTVTGGTSNYIIGAQNNLTGGSKNIVFGDNHILSNKSNNVVIGSADSSKELAASGAVVIGHNADVSVDGGVALGSGSVASTNKDVEGYDPLKKGASESADKAWKSSWAAVSVGDGTHTRQITGVAAGTNDTDAVNVAQIKKLASIDASNIGKNFKDGDVTTNKDVTANENAWGEALGTGTVTKDDDGSKQLVTGGTVYNEVRPSKDGKYVKIAQTTGDNLLKLDDQVKTNTDKLSDVDSRSVKYDTKTENGKTVVDNTKITLAGKGGTTITNLKDGVKNNDAATVGQLNSRIAGVTYTAGNGIAMDSTAKTISAKAGNGITVDTNGINAKAGTGITVNAKGINVNTGKHLSVNTSGKVDVDDNGEVAAEDGNLVTGKTVYDALHGGLDNITVGKDGKDGKDGSIGIAGQNGKDGYTMTYIKTEQGAAGVDGKDGITRVVYQDKDGNGKHTFATLDDGLKFKGDDSTVIARKLNEQLNITGGADSTKLTDKNIGVKSSTDGLKIQLAKDLTSITSISGSTDDKGAKITLDTTDKNISVNGGSIKDVASNLTKDGKIIKGSANNAASISDVQTLVQQGVDNGYTNGNGITIQKDGTSGKNVISVNQGDGLKFDSGKLAVNTGDGLTVDETTKALKIKTSDSNLKVDSNGIGLSDKITIGSDKTKQVTIDGTKGEISGLTNTTWDSKANDYSKSTKAATESQVDAAVKDAVKQAGENDIHVAAGSYAVNDQNQVSMNLVDKNNDTKGTVIITDVAKSSEMGDVSKLADGVKNAGGKTTTVVDAINNVNTSMNTKIGNQNYSTSNTSGSNKYVQDGDSITSAIGKLDGAVQQATTAAGQHSTVSAGSNITVTPAKKTDGHTDYQVALNKDITVDSVTAKTATTDTLTVNKSATIGGVTIANKTISGLDDTKIEKGSTNAVNANTIYNELRPATDGNYIKISNTTAQNIMNLDTQVKRNSDLVNSDGSTIKIGGNDSATKVDISDKNGSGRVVTGVVTDTNDASSAANVGYVNNMAAANTQQIYRDMNNAYGRLDNNINRAAAGSNALAALHPLEFDPDDKLSFAMGYGHYHNANAAAVGAFYQPNSKTQFNFGVALGNGDPGFNAGIAFKLGKSSPYAGMNRVTLIHAVQDLKASEEAKDKRIDALEKENQEMKKQLQAILAKLNG